MEKHLKILGILHIAMGMIALAAVLFFFTIWSGFAGEIEREIAANPQNMPFDPLALLRGIMIFVGLYGAAEVITGIGILDHARWSRVPAMVLGALSLLSFPLGTALGVYTFWVMLDDRTKRLLDGEREVVV